MRDCLKSMFTSYVNVNIFQYKNSSPMNWSGNFLNKKKWNFVDDTDFNKKFHIQSKWPFI